MDRMNPIRVLVVDDHRLFRQGLISLMNTRQDVVKVVGEATSGREALEMAQQLRPDVVLMDILMPDGDGLLATKEICQCMPETAVVMLTSSEDVEHLYQAVQMGAMGYLLKTLDADELFDLLECVARGEAALTRTMAGRLLRNISKKAIKTDEAAEELTERELEVLQWVANGATNPQIAEHLCITRNTVKVHLRNILSKLQVENRTQAAAYAVKSGLVSSEKQPLPIEP